MRRNFFNTFVKNILYLFVGVLSLQCSKVTEQEQVPVTSVTLNYEQITLREGENAVLMATVSPYNADNQKVLWSSGNSAVASVYDGMVTALHPGTTTITAKSDDGGKTATCEVTVLSNIINVESVTLDRSSLELTVGEDYTFTPSINPSDATNKDVIWSSSDEKVAIVFNGVVKTLKTGVAIITVTTMDGKKTASCEVIVSEKVYAVESVSLDQSVLELTVGDDFTLKTTINPENATNKSVTWSSSDETVASVFLGHVTANNPGRTMITVTTEDGHKTASCEVIVSEKVYEVESVSLDQSSLVLTVGDEFILHAEINPRNATNKEVTWSSSDESAATVINGRICTVSPGQTIITVMTVDGLKTATCEVTVLPKPVEGISLNLNTAEIVKGNELMLYAIVTPDDATNKNVIWTSSNDYIATVKDGKVTAVNGGCATITATSADSNMTATCEVTVIVPVTGITMDTSDIRMLVNQTISLYAVVQPTDATNTSIRWSIDNTEVATISDNSITAIGIGTATITATTEDGGYSSQRTVTVVTKDVDPNGSDMNVTEEDF